MSKIIARLPNTVVDALSAAASRVKRSRVTGACGEAGPPANCRVHCRADLLNRQHLARVNPASS